ncbi:DNA polymerase III subunit beta [Ancylobacter pratisalsi]|uniref:Beta sliding clamp n=1 Tax=Ancylobacter pratisalsi TaxID=1745854 RepID=A0A6P1YLM8_9HYPH|nr:DNA polymerase III subunit beta [Ancylobacter pratisalsi]QIB32664.1 DNA polymerase III subunit beta [Ancylobacter pratisalsi]
MKLIVERTHLLAALKAVGHLADRKAAILAVQNIRLRTQGDTLFVAATNLDAYAEAEIPAEVERQGCVAFAADVLQRMVQNFAEGAQVRVDVGETTATIRAGRSRYQPPVLQGDDFPAIFETRGEPARFTLMPEEVLRLFSLIKPAAAKGMKDRPYLEGVYLHASDDEAMLWGVAGSGYVLLAADIPLPEGAAGLPKRIDPTEDDPRQQARGVMVPLESVDHLLRMGGSGIEIETDANVLCARTPPGGAVKVSYATRLIENRYPPYERVVPPLHGPRITVEAGAFVAAVRRLADMAGDDDRAVAIEWGEEGDLSLWLDDHAAGTYGEETLEIGEREGVARVGIKSGFIMKAVEAVGRGRLEIWCAGEKAATRFRNLDDPELIAVASPRVLTRRPHHGPVFETEDAA